MIAYQVFEKPPAPGRKPTPTPHIVGTLGDAYLQQRVVNNLLNRVLPPDVREFNMDVLDGESSTIVDVLARSGNLPFLAEARVVHVVRAERLENMHRATEEGAESAAPKGKPSPSKRLAEGLASLPATTVLILSRTPESPEPGARPGTPRCINAAVDKAIEAKGCIVNCLLSLKDGAQATEILLAEAVARKWRLAPNAASHLVERTGHDIGALLNELEKCAMRAGPDGIVNVAVIDEMTRRKPMDTIFDLTDAIGQREASRALGLMRELVDGGDAPERILTTLVSHLRQLLQARAFLDLNLTLDASLLQRMPPDLAASLPKDNIATLMQFQAWRGRKLSAQARNFSTPQLETALELALATDLANKGIENDGGDSDLLLELLVTRLA